MHDKHPNTLHGGRASGRPRRSPAARRRAVGGVALAAVGALALSACGSADSQQSAAKPKKHGTVLDQPYAKPDATLTGTDGKKFDLAKETKGHPTLLYFGYSHCPDACPLTMNNIAVARTKLSAADRKKLRVLFVTTDPERDTPKKLGSWLHGQDPSFIGLTGDFPTIQKTAAKVAVSVAPTHKKKNGDIVSSHGTEVLAFSPKDDKAHVVYTQDNATPAVLERELPKIIHGRTP